MSHPVGGRCSVKECYILRRNEPARFAMVEVCCLPESSLRISCEKLGYPYLGVSANMEDERVLSKFAAWVRNARREGLWIHVHVSMHTMHTWVTPS